MMCGLNLSLKESVQSLKWHLCRMEHVAIMLLKASGGSRITGGMAFNSPNLNPINSLWCKLEEEIKSEKN